MKKIIGIFCILGVFVLVLGCHQKESKQLKDRGELLEQVNLDKERNNKQEDESNQVKELIWVTDQEINWTKEKEKQLLQFLQAKGWSMVQKVTFVSIEDNSIVDELKKWNDLVEKQECTESVAFVSVHDETLALDLKKKDLCFDFYNMSILEMYPPGNLKEFVPCSQAREVLGDYIAYSTMKQTSDVRQIDIPLVFYYYEEIATILME